MTYTKNIPGRRNQQSRGLGLTELGVFEEQQADQRLQYAQQGRELKWEGRQSLTNLGKAFGFHPSEAGND